jgi:hypothetical protein
LQKSPIGPSGYSSPWGGWPRDHDRSSACRYAALCIDQRRRPDRGARHRATRNPTRANHAITDRRRPGAADPVWQGSISAVGSCPSHPRVDLPISHTHVIVASPLLQIVRASGAGSCTQTWQHRNTAIPLGERHEDYGPYHQ